MENKEVITQKPGSHSLEAVLLLTSCCTGLSSIFYEIALFSTYTLIFSIITSIFYSTSLNST